MKNMTRYPKRLRALSTIQWHPYNISLSSLSGIFGGWTHPRKDGIGSNACRHPMRFLHDNHSTEPTSLADIIHNKKTEILDSIPLRDIRNFSIVAHVDHGKSSLASRILEHVGNTKSRQDNPKEHIELLDTLEVEQERGITVKATAASILYKHPYASNETGYLLLNMVDTPGHADFHLEVQRTLSFVQGALLLFDASQGIQAQTLSVYEKAKKLGVHLIPALTKVDLENARVLDVTLAISDLFDFDPDEVLLTSARRRVGVREVLDAVCEQIPPPMAIEAASDGGNSMLYAQVVDSWFEPLRGVVCLLQILSGSLVEGDRISPISSSAAEGKEHFSVQEIGFVLPRRVRTGSLACGQMGYAIVGMRNPHQAKPGTLLVLHKDLSKITATPIPKKHPFQSSQQKSVLYASVHPMYGEGFDELSTAVDRLALNDTGLEVHRTGGMSNKNEGGPYLGPGLRIGFQGLLHVDIFRQRLLDEFGLEAIVTPPKVPYIIRYKPMKGGEPQEQLIEDLPEWPSPSDKKGKFLVREPMIDICIMSPSEYAGSIMDLIKRKRGGDMMTKPIDDRTWLFTARMPWAEVVIDFHDELKNCSAGYASYDTTEADPPFQEANLCKVDILLNGDIVHPLSFVTHRDSAHKQGKSVCQKLRDVLPRQQFVIVIQAKADGKIVASERVRAYRKDVLTKAGKTVGGGDVTRKKKLLEKQKKGKKRQQSFGKVSLSQEAFNSVISRSS